MPAGTIRVAPQQMRSTAQRVKSDAGEWKRAVDQINVHVAEMSNMWDGLGNDSFIRLFQNERQLFDRLYMLMCEYYEAITRAAQLYEEGEQAVAGIVARRN